MNNIAVIGIGKITGREIILLVDATYKEAERFCEQWGWFYDDGKEAYTLMIVA